MLEIPIPPLYFGRLSGGKLEVIDGQQRLTTLINFVTNQFALQRLTAMPSLNGLKFRELSTEYQEKIKDTPIRTVEINAGNNTNLRFEIFERLNRGSMALNEQELRNCVFRGEFNVLLSELEKDAKWRSVKGGESPEPRFKEREMILRLLALANRVNFFKGGLKRFLNDYMANYAPRDATAIDEQARIFWQAMQNVYTVFGQHSGRLYSVPPGALNGGWDTKFSIAALEIQASALFGQDPAKVQRVADQIREYFLLLLLTDRNIQEAISVGTGGSAPTKLRWTAFKSAIQPLLDNVLIEPRFFNFQLRKELYDKNPICALCNNQILSFEDCAVDHIIPYSKEGKTVRENGQLSHRSCNARKNAAMPPDIRSHRSLNCRRLSAGFRGRRHPVQRRDWSVTDSEQSNPTVEGGDRSAAGPFVLESWLGATGFSYEGIDRGEGCKPTHATSGKRTSSFQVAHDLRIVFDAQCCPFDVGGFDLVGHAMFPECGKAVLDELTLYLASNSWSTNLDP